MFAILFFVACSTITRLNFPLLAVILYLLTNRIQIVKCYTLGRYSPFKSTECWEFLWMSCLGPVQFKLISKHLTYLLGRELKAIWKLSARELVGWKKTITEFSFRPEASCCCIILVSFCCAKRRGKETRTSEGTQHECLVFHTLTENAKETSSCLLSD